MNNEFDDNTKFSKELSFEDMSSWGWTLVELEKIKIDYPLKSWYDCFIKLDNELKISIKNLIQNAYRKNFEMKKRGISFQERQKIIGDKLKYTRNLPTYKLIDKIYDNLWFGAIDSLERVGLESFIRINWELLTIKKEKGG